MKTKKSYRWANAAYEAVIPAPKFGQWLESLPDQNPSTIVSAAADQESPAHALFSWDDVVAAREHRLSMARRLLSSFVIDTIVTTKTNGERTLSVPAVMRSAPGQYQFTASALRVEESRDFILREALAELARVKRRYASLSDLATVFAAIDEVSARVARRRSAA